MTTIDPATLSGEQLVALLQAFEIRLGILENKPEAIKAARELVEAHEKANPQPEYPTEGEPA